MTILFKEPLTNTCLCWSILKITQEVLHKQAFWFPKINLLNFLEITLVNCLCGRSKRNNIIKEHSINLTIGIEKEKNYVLCKETGNYLTISPSLSHIFVEKKQVHLRLPEVETVNFHVTF